MTYTKEDAREQFPHKATALLTSRGGQNVYLLSPSYVECVSTVKAYQEWLEVVTYSIPEGKEPTVDIVESCFAVSSIVRISEVSDKMWDGYLQFVADTYNQPQSLGEAIASAIPLSELTDKPERML